MLCDANGTPLRFLLSGGQASDISYAQPLLEEVSIPSSQRGRPRLRSVFVTETGRQGVPLGKVMAMTEHRSITTVMGYFQAGGCRPNCVSSRGTPLSFGRVLVIASSKFLDQRF